METPDPRRADPRRAEMLPSSIVLDGLMKMVVDKLAREADQQRIMERDRIEHGRDAGHQALLDRLFRPTGSNWH